MNKGLQAKNLPEVLGRNKIELTEKGYTVVEVIIALSVTSLLFVSVATLLGGRQAIAQFTQGVRTYESLIQNVSSETSNGYYRTEFGCNVGAGDYSYTFGDSSDSNPGANVGCVFIGKALVPHTTEETTHVLTLIGRQFQAGSTGDLANTIEESQPVVVPATNNIDEVNEHRYGLLVNGIEDSAGNDLSALVFMLPTSGGVANPGFSGSSSGVLLFGVTGVVSNFNQFVIDRIRNFDSSEVYPLRDGATICVRSQSNDLKAEIVVGANNSQSGIVTTIDSNFTGGCHD